MGFFSLSYLPNPTLFEDIFIFKLENKEDILQLNVYLWVISQGNLGSAVNKIFSYAINVDENYILLSFS